MSDDLRQRAGRVGEYADRVVPVKRQRVRGMGVGKRAADRPPAADRVHHRDVVLLDAVQLPAAGPSGAVCKRHRLRQRADRPVKDEVAAQLAGTVE